MYMFMLLCIVYVWRTHWGPKKTFFIDVMKRLYQKAKLVFILKTSVWIESERLKYTFILCKP